MQSEILFNFVSVEFSVFGEIGIGFYALPASKLDNFKAVIAAIDISSNTECTGKDAVFQSFTAILKSNIFFATFTVNEKRTVNGPTAGVTKNS